MEYTYFYILCSCEWACAHTSSPDLLLTTLLRVPAKPYLRPALLPGDMNNSMPCPNSCPLGGISQSPSVQRFAHVWLEMRGVGEESWQCWGGCAERRPTPAGELAARSPVTCEPKALGTARTCGHQNGCFPFLHSCFPNLPEISLVGRTDW